MRENVTVKRMYPILFGVDTSPVFSFQAIAQGMVTLNAEEEEYGLEAWGLWLVWALGVYGVAATVPVPVTEDGGGNDQLVEWELGGGGIGIRIAAESKGERVR